MGHVLHGSCMAWAMRGMGHVWLGPLPAAAPAAAAPGSAAPGGDAPMTRLRARLYAREPACMQGHPNAAHESMLQPMASVKGHLATRRMRMHTAALSNSMPVMLFLYAKVQYQGCPQNAKHSTYHLFIRMLYHANAQMVSICGLY